jgi:murein DD-endopeptidase MepM/ murein hydrolase activator NlpD
MSYRSSQYADCPQQRAHDHHRHPSRQAAARAPARKDTQDGYTLAHAGRQVRFGPVVFWIAVGTVTLLGIWSAATATYFAFRDDVLTRLISRQADMQYAYEDRIAELRARVDRTTSRQLLDQEQFNKKLDEIMRRQAVLESHATALNTLPDSTVTGSVKGLPPGKAEKDADASPSGGGKPLPIARPQPARFGKTTSPVNKLLRLESSLDRVENRQIAELNSVENRMESRLRRMRGVFSELGLNAPRMETGSQHSGTGGPYVPVKLRDASPFERQLYRVNLTRAQIDRLNGALALVPYRKPVMGEIEFTSGFGVRMDPFVGRPAMHTGVDFRASMGDPVRATANGKVVSAGWSGGYGRMVEIDHGNGLSTRYGHLSAINVNVGQSVKIGQVVGEVGSTGRSTGPHLHYETRIDGEAVDPRKFLRAGMRLSDG